MINILIGIPSTRYRQDFLLSLSELILGLSSKYKIEAIEVRGKLIDEARNKIVDIFMSKDYEFLLFLDDDHSGHKVEMVDALLKPLVENNEYICAMKCYTRDFPHLPNLMNYAGEKNPLGKDSIRGRYEAIGETKGYFYCNLVGFGMTLIHRSLFEKIVKPYFVGDYNQREDNYFCDKLQENGIKPVGCFDYTLTHDGVDESNVNRLNEEGTLKLKETIKKQWPEYQGQDLLIVA